ncbi:hypothetical protein MPH_04349, partial [Macrophomina phaseolina MS6]
MSAHLAGFDFSGIPDLGAIPIIPGPGNPQRCNTQPQDSQQQSSSSAGGVKQPIPLA